ncbi:MAG: RNase H family protein [Plesiomonas shigelloides]
MVSDSGEVKEAFALDYNSAQAAELIALIRACELMTGKRVTIYTDSKYAWRVLHHYANMWEARNFPTADGKPIAHANLIGQLTEAVQLQSRQSRIALPKLGLIILIRHYHGLSHTSCAKVVQAINQLYCICRCS